MTNVSDDATNRNDIDTCCTTWTDVHRMDLCAATSDDRAAIFDCSGRMIWRIPEPVETSDRVVILPRTNRVVVGRYGKKTVTAYDFGSPTARWRRDGFKQMYTVSCVGGNRIIVNLIPGACEEIHADDGRTLARITGVTAVLSDSVSDRILLVRGRRRSASYSLELRSSLATDPVLVAMPAVYGYPRAAWGPGWVAVTENDTGGIWCIGDEGALRWHHAPAPNHHYPSITSVPDCSQIFAIRRSFFRGHANVACLFESATGAMLWEKEVPTEHLAYDPAGSGSLLVGSDGILSVPDLAWEERRFVIG